MLGKLSDLYVKDKICLILDSWNGLRKSLKGRNINMKKHMVNWLPADNYLFSVLQNSQIHYEKFVLENYIQMECNLNFGYAINIFSDMYQYNNFECFEIVQFNLNQLDLFSTDIKQIIKKAIDYGYNFLIPVDTFFISQYSTANKFHASHEINVCGYYDDFFIAQDFFDFKKYKRQNCLQTEVERAIINYNKVEHISPNYNIVGLKLKDINTIQDFNIKKFYDGLKNFMSWDKPVSDIYYGIAWFDGIIADLNENKYRDFRVLEMQFLLEHISLMMFRLKYLIQKRNIKFLQDILESCMMLYNEVENYKLKLLKITYQEDWNQSKDDNIRRNSIEKLKELKNKYGILLLNITKIIK